MRVLFAVFPARAHVHPVVPLAWALQNAGHQVRVAIHPDAVDLVAEAGLVPVPLGSPDLLRDAMEWNDNFEKLESLPPLLSMGSDPQPHWEQQWNAMLFMLSRFTPMFDEVLGYCREWRPDLVIWDQFCVAAAVAAKMTGAAHARFLWAQDNVGLLRSTWIRARDAQRVDGAADPVEGLLRPMLEPHGLWMSEEFLLGQWTIDPMPAALRLPLDIHYEAVRRVPFNGNAVLPRWLDARPARPRVCLTLGVGGRGRQLFRESGVAFPDLVTGLSALDIELVVTLHARLRAMVQDVPDNVRLVEYLPLNHLLPSCSAVIHHGGGGTFAAAAAHRVPQLVTPMPFWSEGVTARFVEDRGAGIVVEPRDLTVEVLCKRLTELLEDAQYRTAADALHRELAAVPGPGELVPVLESLTERHRG